jgi:hypothetical protein
MLIVKVFAGWSERLTCPKDKGGLSFCNFGAFNMAMVAKQA